MAFWEIRNISGAWVGTQNSGDTAEQALALFVERATRPVYCPYHSEMRDEQVERISGSKMVYWKPRAPDAVSAVRMREVYMGGGYCRVPFETAAA